MLDEKVIEEQYEKFMELIEQDDRSENLKKMYEDFGAEELASAPASGRVHYHNAFIGGYLDHVLRVRDLSFKILKTFTENGGVIDFTPQELSFAALHHDLGKLGFPGEPHYVPEKSDWHRNNLGQMFKHNEQVQYMSVTDKALFLLQKYGVQVTRNEWLAIHLSDGMYDDANKSYLKNNMYPYPMKTNLPYIIHMGDYMSMIIEKESGKF